ncbi:MULTISPECIES: hypothetical protein [Acidithrix]|uniref:Uncharacterized protein n=1 Tax=Acidithrix ferrooxidans TaxID=1280514 RepID=A0A0D8HKP1_9ACTN|nr:MULTISPECIES: hypothetical protein [Acidithrix]KJF18444.1 hypothetical protein AXFE_06720 [Acidithrix ferrooxidans]CAG4934754.1 unnamed protein product [Acidithrix sp. C25]
MTKAIGFIEFIPFASTGPVLLFIELSHAKAWLWLKGNSVTDTAEM